jgi:hypothetical protein
MCTSESVIYDLLSQDELSGGRVDRRDERHPRDDRNDGTQALSVFIGNAEIR